MRQLQFDLIVWYREWKVCPDCNGDGRFCLRCLDKGGWWVARLKRILGD